MYVDDLLITGTDKSLIDQGIAYMSSHFKVKDLGPLKFFLGVEVCRSSSCIYLHQH